MKIGGADKALNSVMQWATRDGWVEPWGETLGDHIVPACEDLGLEFEALEPALGDIAFNLVFACAFEDFVTRTFGDDDANIIDDYLKRRAWKESGSGRAYLRGLRTSVMSLYEVVDADPGRSMVVRDLIRGGDPVRVDERSGSQHVDRWDRLALRFVTSGGRSCLAGGVLRFPHDAADTLLEGIDKVAKKERTAARRRAKRTGLSDDTTLDAVKAALLPELAPVFTRFWLLTTLGERSRPMPRMVNRDGHDLAFTEIHYPVEPGVRADVEARLDGWPDMDRDGDREPAWTWFRDLAGAPAGTASDDGQFWVFGRAELRPDALVLSFNSFERAETAMSVIAERLDGLVGRPLTSVQTLEAALADQPETGRNAATEDADVSPEIAGPLIQQFMDDHYRKMLRQPIAMLDGKTPKQAARSKKGREQIVAWLKHLENAEARRARNDPTAGYDFGWMWEDLGVANWRK